MYDKVECQRLLYIRSYQTKLSAKSNVHFQDALRTEGNIQSIRQFVIVLSSFTNGPRYMHERIQNANDICQDI